MLQELREELDKLLEEKITNPGVTNWNANSKEGALLTAIINLVTTEEKQNQRNSDYDTYSVRERNANWSKDIFYKLEVPCYTGFGFKWTPDVLYPNKNV